MGLGSGDGGREGSELSKAEINAACAQAMGQASLYCQWIKFGERSLTLVVVMGTL